jgi:hypothetical protein
MPEMFAGADTGRILDSWKTNGEGGRPREPIEDFI